MRTKKAWATMAVVAVLLVPLTAMAGIGPESDPDDVYWDDQFPASSVGVNGTVYAMVRDSAGDLYVGGDFTAAGNLAANNIAKWEAASGTWSALGDGVNGSVKALVVSGGTLYAGGTFTTADGVTVNNVARWNGVSWSALGAGMNDSINSLVLDQAGKLYAGGGFTAADGKPANRIARWDGTTWSTFGNGLDNTVFALASDQAGNIYVGGRFLNAGGVAANAIARLNSGIWYAMGTGVFFLLNTQSVYAITVAANGTVYVGGTFQSAGGWSTSCVASWNGSAWSSMAGGLGLSVYALASDDAGNLFAGGTFTTTKGAHVSKWNGTAWSTMGAGADEAVYCLAADGLGKVYAGGGFVAAGEAPANHLSHWDGAAWTGLGSTDGITGSVSALTADDDGNIFIGGAFVPTLGGDAKRVAKWNGDEWSALGDGISGAVNALAADHSGNLYAGGVFTSAGGGAANNVAQWDGVAWGPLGTGTSGVVNALVVAESGGIYAGGQFIYAGGVTVNNVALWNGTEWLPLGIGVNGRVNALVANGAEILYAGGSFTTAGGVTAAYVAKWDGTTWSPLGTGMGGMVNALAMDADGNLYAGGNFTTAGGVAAAHIARWDGVQWSPLGTGADDYVYALASDRSGSLYVGGAFDTVDGSPANHLVKWDGSQWLPLGSGVNGVVDALLVRGNALFAGGSFTTAGSKTSESFALWQPRVDHSESDLGALPGAVTVGDSAYGLCRPALMTAADTTITFDAGLPVTVTLDRADEIAVGGVRVNGATTVGPAGVEFGEAGASLRIEFSEDEVAAYGVDYMGFRVVRLTYPDDYPASKEAESLSAGGADTPVPVRVDNGRQIYAVTVFNPVMGATYGAVPATFLTFHGPSNPSATAVGIDTITWAWQDNSNNETGFNVWVDPGAGPPTTLVATMAADVTSFRQNGLATNAQYAFQVEGLNPDGDNLKTDLYTAWTLAAVPAAPVVGGVLENSVTIAVGTGDGNPSYTEYALSCPTTGQWVQADGTLAAEPAWRPAAGWGVTRVIGLTQNTPHVFAVMARNGANVTTDAGPSASVTTGEATIPTGSILINGGAPCTGSNAVALALDASDASGVVAMRFKTSGATWATPWLAWEPFVSTRDILLKPDDGFIRVHVEYRDAAGNVSEDIWDEIVLDTTPPSGLINIYGGPLFTEVTVTHLVLHATDLTPEGSAGSGVADMRFTENGLTWTEWKPYAQSEPYTVKEPDGYKTVVVQYRDAAGNVSIPHGATVQLLVGAPTGSIRINGNDSTTTNPNVTLTMTWEGGGGTGVKTMRFSDDGAHWTYWESVAPTKAHTLPGTNGYKTVRVQFADDAGHTSIAYNDYILLQSKSPTGTITINNGASATNSRDVTLSLTWLPGGDHWPVAKMRFSDDGAHWSLWETVSATKAYTLPGPDGHNTVRVQFRDLVGNVSVAYSDYILLDTTPPTGTITINGGASVTSSPAVWLTLTWSDGPDGSGVTRMRFSDDGATWSAWEAVTPIKGHMVSGNNGYKTVRVQYRDAAGNYSERFNDYILLKAY